jgi:hypothetical protein
VWIPNNIMADVDRVARVHYIDFADCMAWNAKRDKATDLRLMSGWAWTSKDGTRWEQSLKSKTAAYIHAWYTLVAKREAPTISRRPRLRVVGDRRAA